MTRLALILALLASGAAGVAVLTYGNAAAQCSGSVDQIMIAPNGIAARVIVSIGATGDTREHLTVTPLDPAYIAIPDRVAVLDGETVAVRIMLPMF